MDKNRDLNWAVLGTGVIANEMAQALVKMNKRLYAVANRTHQKALDFAERYGVQKVYDQIDEDIEVYFPVIRREDEEKGGDITTSRYTDKQGKNYWVHPNNIEDAIYTLFLDDFFDREKILPKDITEIIQIVDTDGAYISDECIVEDSSLQEEESPFYKDDEIACLDVEKIKLRNQQKSENLTYLSKCSTIKVKQKTVPYSVYYFSSNLEFHQVNNL